MNRRLFPWLIGLSLVFFVVAPILIVRAPLEQEMGLIQKIFYFHFSAWMAMYLSICVLGISSAQFLFRRKPAADRLAVSAAEAAIVFGLMGLITGPIWAVKSWGVWWNWDARTTIALILELILVAYLLLRSYGGPGSDRLAAGLGMFAMANLPFLYISTNIWRTIHPPTSVVPTLPVDFGIPLWWSFAGFIVLCLALLTARVRLEEQRATLDRLYLALEDE
ncbi:MAG: cytochrome c biogenesis protein CcsA [Acidobacteriota bacterium]|nr:cytochrome c biogenesis protein CcsA [Acidobacteriota bacterium]